MDIAERINNEHVNIGRSQEEVANKAQNDLAEITLTIDAEREYLREDDNRHGDQNNYRHCLI